MTKKRRGGGYYHEYTNERTLKRDERFQVMP